MEIVSYPNGHGLRERPPECAERPERVPCPCCQGAGEHAYGAGMDADSAPCRVCMAQGELAVSTVEETQAVARIEIQAAGPGGRGR